MIFCLSDVARFLEVKTERFTITSVRAQRGASWKELEDERVHVRSSGNPSTGDDHHGRAINIIHC
jgi:hypothetical protein